MQYFTEQASTHREALEKIRLKYGDQAKILKHRTVKIGGFLGLFAKEGVEVSGYVAEQITKKVGINIEEEKRKILENLKGDTNVLQTLLEEVRSIKEKVDMNGAPRQPLHQSLGKIEELLHRNDFSADFIKGILEKCRKTFSMEDLDDYRIVEKQVLQWIGEAIGIYQDELRDSGPKISVLVGPTGVGKTTTIAKLAAIYGVGTTGEKPVKVRLLTADNYRIGAKKQLETYGDIMGIPVAGVETYQDFKKKLAIFGDADLILVDTTGKSPRNYKGLAEMREILDACGSKAEIHLTLSATTKISDMVEIMQQFEPFKYKSVILTKLDETVHLGNIISVLADKQKPISYLTFGQGVPQDIEKASVEEILRHLDGFSVESEELEWKKLSLLQSKED